MSRAATGRVVLLVLLSVAVAVPVVATPGPVPDDGYRIFYSADHDHDPESRVDSPPDRDEVDPAGYARVGDLSFRTTRPSLSVDNTTLWEYRRRQLAAIERSRRRAIRFPHSPPGRSSGGLSPLITDAHITYMGVNGGAEPLLGLTRNSRYPVFVGRSGEVLNVVDFRFHPERVPMRYRDRATRSYRTATREIDGTETTVYLDGNRTRVRYRFPISTDRRVLFGGETIARGDERALQYHNLTGETGTLELRADITLEVVEVTEEFDWDPTTRPATTPADGSWELVGRRSTVVDEASVTVRDERRVHVTGDGSITVEQTVIQQGNRSHVVLGLSGPNATTYVGPEALSRRLLLSSIEMTDDTRIAMSWATYTMRRYETATEIGPSGTVRAIDPPNVLRMKLMGLYQSATVNTNRSSTPGTARVIGFEALPVTPGTRGHPEQVNFPVRRPVVFRSIVVADAPAPVRAVRTIHGRDVPVAVDRRVPYRRPNVTIRPQGNGRVAITVTDPVTGDPLAGRNLTVEGGDPAEGTTGHNGTVMATPTDVYFRVTTERDPLLHPGDVFYDRVSVSRTFLPLAALRERLARFLLTCVTATPLILLLFLVRNRELLV